MAQEELLEEQEELEIEQPEQESSEEAVKEEPKEEKPVEEDVRIRNLRLIAKSKEKLKAENMRIEAEKKALEERLKKYEEEEEDEFEDETTVAFKKKIAAMEDKQRKQEEAILRFTLEKIENKLLSKYVDFADVVSPTNVSILESMEDKQDLIKAIANEPDLYKKGVMAYEAIRSNKIYDSALEVESNKEAIIKNMSKPQSSVSSPKKTSESSSAFADLHSRDYQNQLRKKLDLAKSRV